MIKKVNFLEFDTDKTLDYAVFMAIEARRKCIEGWGCTAPDRLELSIKGLQEVLDEIETAADDNVFPSVHYLTKKNII